MGQIMETEDLNTLNAIVKTLWGGKVGNKPILILEPGKIASVQVKGAGNFDVICRGPISIPDKIAFEVHAPEIALLSLNSSDAVCQMVIRAVGQLVSTQGIPEPTVRKWLATKEFADAVLRSAGDCDKEALAALASLL